MKNLKKILALVLAFACAFTMFAVAGAADFTDKDKIKNYEAVNTLVALNILKGRDDGSFDPDATVTRAEMAKMIFVIWNGGKDDATAYETMDTIFSDVSSHWAKGYINFCAANNIIAGMGDGTFAPDQTVTGQQAAKMLLVLMGYDDQHAGLTGHKWAQNTMSYAGLAGLFKDVEAPVEQGMPRQYAAQMVYNTLEANRVKWSTDNNSFDEITQWSGQNFVKETVGRRYMNYATVEGILVEARNGDEKGFTLSVKSNAQGQTIPEYDLDDTTRRWTDTKYTVDLSEYLGQEVKVSYNTDEHDKNRDNSIYGVYSTENNVVVTTTANKIADPKEEDRIKIDGTKYKIEDGLRYYYSTTVDGKATDLTTKNYIDNNGTELKNVFGNLVFGTDNKLNVNSDNKPVAVTGGSALYADYEPYVANTVKFVDYDNDGRFDLAIDYPMAVAEVSMVSSSTISVKDARGVELSTNSPKREDVVEYEGIAKGDIVQITWDAFKDKVKFTKLETTDETVGSVRNANDKNDEFNISAGWVKRFTPTLKVNSADKTGLMGVSAIDTRLKSGDKATFAVIGGIAYYVDRTQSGTGNDVAVVVNTGYSGTNGANGTTIEAKLMFADGTTSVVDVESVIVNGTDDKYDLDESALRTALSDTTRGAVPSNATDIKVLDYYLTAENLNYSDLTNQNGQDIAYGSLLSSGKIAPALVTYSRSGNDYTLQLLDDKHNNNDAGYDVVDSKAHWTRPGSDAKVGNWNLLDDGTVFVVYGTSVKRYTGAQAKKLSVSTDSNNLTPASGQSYALAYSLVEKSNGVERVRIAAVNANDKPSVHGTGNYAYLLDKATSKTIDGTSYLIFDAYTKNGAETLYWEESANSTSRYDKGMVIDFSYTDSNITDNGAEYKVIDDVDYNIGARLAAITGWDRNDISVLAEYKDTNGTWKVDPTSKDVDTDDTTVLIVDTDGKVGVSVGKDGIQTADTPRKNSQGHDVYQVNAKVIYDSRNDYYDLIVIDSVNNWMDNDWQISVDSAGVCYKGSDTNNVNDGNNSGNQGNQGNQGNTTTTVDIYNGKLGTVDHAAAWTLKDVYAEISDSNHSNNTYRVPANQTLRISITPTVGVSAGTDSSDLHINAAETTNKLYLGATRLTGDTIDLSKIKGQTGSTLELRLPGDFETTMSYKDASGNAATYNARGIEIKVEGKSIMLGSVANDNNGLTTLTWNGTAWN